MRKDRITRYEATRIIEGIVKENQGITGKEIFLKYPHEGRRDYIQKIIRELCTEGVLDYAANGGFFATGRIHPKPPPPSEQTLLIERREADIMRIASQHPSGISLRSMYRVWNPAAKGIVYRQKATGGKASYKAFMETVYRLVEEGKLRRTGRGTSTKFYPVDVQSGSEQENPVSESELIKHPMRS